MADVRSAIVQSLTNAQSSIRANMESEHVNASGRTSKSLRVEDRGDRIVLVIGGSQFGRTAPLETLEIGSKPAPRGDWFKSVIFQWTKDKGMSFPDDDKWESHRWAVSTIIARNIEEFGTERHRNPINVYTSVVEQTKRDIQSLIYGDFREMIRTQIKSIK